VRFFTGVFPSPETEKFLSSLTQSLPKRLPVGWVSGGNFHLTLNFLEDVEEEKIGTLAATVKRTLKDQRRFELMTDGVGVFPEPAKPRIVYLGFRGEIGRLRQVQKRLETALLTAGFLPKTARIFVPHLTLGRISKPPAGKEGRRLARRLRRLEAMARGERFVVEEIVLARSQLNRGEPRYEKVEQFRLT
jgi:2'-5' RNA ligase